MFAECEGNASSAVVCARAVVGYAAAELTEEEQGHVVAGVVLPQVSNERVNGVGNVCQQRCVSLGLVGVGIKPIVWGCGVQDPGAEAGEVGLCDVLHILADGGGRVLNTGRVVVRGRGQNVCTLQGVGAGRMDVVHDRAGADGGGVHAAEHVKRVVPLVLALDTCQ